MRDLILTALIFISIPYIISRPQIGIYMWSWLAYMNPQRLTYGFAYSMPFSQVVAIAAMISLLFWKEPKRIPITGLTLLWMGFIIWMLITTYFAIHPEPANQQLIKILKIQLVTILTIMVIKTKRDLNILVWVIAFSIGFYGIKGGVFTIQSLGAFRVWGPAGSFIEDNNELALALLMVIPLFYYLITLVKKKVIKYVLMLCIVLMVISVFGSQSRGAFLAIGASAFFLWLKTPNKLVTGSMIIVLGIAAISLMPQSWHERMNTINTYQEDASAMGRINAWKMAANFASDRITGGGLNMWSPTAYQQYSDNPATWATSTAAHSIYFSVLGEHGWTGLILFLSIFFASWRTSKHIIKHSKGYDDLLWLGTLTRMIQVSFVAYMAGGAFLSLAYFDLPWHLISLLVICKNIVDNNKRRQGEKPQTFASDSTENKKQLQKLTTINQ